MKQNIITQKINITVRSLLREAQKQKIKISQIYAEMGTFLLEKNGKKRYIACSCYSGNSRVSAIVTKEKMITKLVLLNNRINTPRGYFIDVRKRKKPLIFFVNHFQFPFVLKQSDSSLSKNVFIINDKKELIGNYNSFYRNKINFIAEEFIDGTIHRILVIKGKIIAIAKYDSTNVVGDGKNTIEKLIEMKNKDPRRGKLGNAPLVKIKIDDIVKNFLKKQELHLKSTLSKNQKIFLRPDQNISTGGDSIDCTDKYHPNYGLICKKIFQSIPELKITGVDLITHNIAKDPYEIGYSVIELNSRPDFDLHEDPYLGKKRNIAKEILKVMFE